MGLASCVACFRQTVSCQGQIQLLRCIHRQPILCALFPEIEIAFCLLRLFLDGHALVATAELAKARRSLMLSLWECLRRLGGHISLQHLMQYSEHRQSLRLTRMLESATVRLTSFIHFAVRHNGAMFISVLRKNGYKFPKLRGSGCAWELLVGRADISFVRSKLPNSIGARSFCWGAAYSDCSERKIEKETPRNSPR